MNVLFAVPYVPTLIRVRPYNLIRQLTALGHQVTVMTVWTNEQERDALGELDAFCNQVEAVQMPGWRSLWNCVWALPSKKPLQMVYSWEKSLAKASFERILQTNGGPGYDVIHVEHLRGAQYGLYLKERMEDHRLDIPIIWDSVDSISHLFRQATVRSKSVLSRGITRLELKRTEPFEGWLTTQFDRTLVTSNLDRQAMLSLKGSDGQDRITVLRNGVDLDYFQPGDPDQRELKTLLASGKMSYHANVTMVLRLVESIMPAVWARDPEVKVVIVGKDPPKRIQELAEDARVTVTGTVKDIRPYLQKATIATAPIEYGAGIQNKVLEAMACGTPVVATPQAVSAIDLKPGEDALIAEEAEAFADSILALIHNKDLQRTLSENGRAFVDNNHRWSAIAGQLESVYKQEIESKLKVANSNQRLLN